jgi:GDP-D-mannose dehydratase
MKTSINQFMPNVLVTGADGFIGSHLTEMLLEQGYIMSRLYLIKYKIFTNGYNN